MSLGWLTSIAGIVVLVGASPGGWAATQEGSESLQAVIRAAVERQPITGRDATREVEIGAIDPRLHLAACPAPEVFIPAGNMPATTARVSCRDPFWTLYVPLRLHLWEEVVVAASNIAPGTKLSESDVTLSRLDTVSLNGDFLTDPAQADGKILRASVRAGSPILAPLLDRPMIVHRGDQLVMTVLDSAITIKVSVVAMEDGRAGDRITVQNPDSKKMLRATVTDGGAVEIRFDEAQEGE